MKIKTNKIRKGTNWVVYAQYAYASYEAGEVVSQHKTEAAAVSAAKNNSFVAVGHVREVVVD